MSYPGPKRNALPELYGTAFRKSKWRCRGGEQRRARAASAAGRRRAQRRLAARGGEDRLRHVGRGRAREGDRRPRRGRRRHPLPALPAALGPGQGGVPARGGRVRGRRPGAGGGARPGRRAGAVAAPLYRVPRDQARARGRPALRRPGLRRAARVLRRPPRARPRIAARGGGGQRRDPGRHQPRGTAARRGHAVHARPGRRRRLQPADGGAAHRRAALRRRGELSRAAEGGATDRSGKRF